ncbi:MAG TPA: BTAD domain-containing putative transcriptional regulator [Stackebrandtia sp.]|jgi:DNA-binding SARP family transcriptional activator/tetratricopeptide (TPR) repeat protein|uniref:AfsR/SARP family transcriptional regulator n=1 Tax=Stackebrandtia sp. TaxID=2023065 RepID=UPI002D2871D9|nr:BTAD domain-containing putative transcriptional regulator [Stackebrandtia sp.]HZE41054.1 BTAD domain-containing putative transcriptional regulator [Stackebrandtia sp.]
MAVEFRVLGPVEVHHPGHPIDIGHARQRAVLAILVAEANRAVAVDQLAARVWGDDPPRRARETVYSYLSRLRSALAPFPEVAIERRSGGYVLNADPDSIDLHRFRRLAAEARREPDGPQALALFASAGDAWRSAAFEDMDVPWLNSVATALDTERLGVELDGVDAALRLGRPGEVLPRLGTRAEEHPLDERIAAQLMLALYLSGRQSDALDQFRRTRDALVDQLGTEPGPRLRELQQRILAADPTLTPEPRERSNSAARAMPVPQQLPPMPPRFTGRTAELDVLDAAAVADGALVVITGPGGIGKTWLTLQWAHHNTDRFGDGQLYVNLRGFDPAGEPARIELVLRSILTALGVDAAAMPADTDALAGLYRSLVVDKRMLIFLDNARDAAQVEPLLPGSRHCVTLVTSRVDLAALATSHGAQRMMLSPLDTGDAYDVLAAQLGARRAAAEPAALRELLDCCDGLPLALGILAARAATHPDFPLSALAAELRDEDNRLDTLDAGELSASLRGVFDGSRAALGGRAAVVFDLLGLCGGADIGVPGTASLTALPPASARRTLRELETAHLIEQPEPGRFRMHNLTRLYAAERGAELDATLRFVAAERQCDFYLHSACSANQNLLPDRGTITLEPPATGCVPLEVDAESASDWFDREYPNILEAQRFAAKRGWDSRVWRLAWAISGYQWARWLNADAEVCLRQGLDAASRLGDDHATMLMHRHIGQVQARLSHEAEAAYHLAHSAELADRLGSAQQRIHAHAALASHRENLGDLEGAREHAAQVRDLARVCGDHRWEARALNTIGWLAARAGDHEIARMECQTALELHNMHGDPDSGFEIHNSLGHIAQLCGDPDAAVEHFQQAVDITRRIGDQNELGRNLTGLGEALGSSKQFTLARRALQEARTIYSALHRSDKVSALTNKLGALESQVRQGIPGSTPPLSWHRANP